jgi:hypothetical protein
MAVLEPSKLSLGVTELGLGGFEFALRVSLVPVDLEPGGSEVCPPGLPGVLWAQAREIALNGEQ